MKLPHKAQASVAKEKIVDYLLNDEHEIGQHKARFFQKFGFSSENWETLQAALLQHALEREVVQVKSNPYGEKYELHCDLSSPDERNPCVVSVWIIETGSEEPRFVTSYPGDK